jgi:hypothetical protein
MFPGVGRRRFAAEVFEASLPLEKCLERAKECIEVTDDGTSSMNQDGTRDARKGDSCSRCYQRFVARGIEWRVAICVKFKSEMFRRYASRISHWGDDRRVFASLVLLVVGENDLKGPLPYIKTSINFR